MLIRNPSLGHRIVSKIGERKRAQGIPLDTSTYGRKAAEGKDLNEDTNFGKLDRIPHPKLEEFLRKYGLNAAVEKEPKLPEVIKEVKKTLNKLEEET